MGDSRITSGAHICVSVSWLSCDGVKNVYFNVKDVEAYFFKCLVPRNSLKKTDIKDRLLSHSPPPCLSLSVRVHTGCGRNRPGQKPKTRRRDTIFHIETGF